MDIATNEATSFTSYYVDDLSVSTGPATTFRLKLITQGSGDPSSTTKIVTSTTLDAGVWTQLQGTTSLAFNGASLSTLKVGIDTTGESSSFSDFFLDHASVTFSKTGHNEHAMLEVVEASSGNSVMSYNASTLTPGISGYWESSCVSAGHYTVVASVAGGATSRGWGTGAFFAAEDRDGGSLVPTTSFDSGASVSKTFMAGKAARCTVPKTEDNSGVDYSNCYGKKQGWKCVVGCAGEE